jgi:alpha-methylacyl-CoA racemase
MSMFFTMAASGAFTDQRGTNLLDGGAHFYDTYETKDGKYVCLGSIEPQFYALLVEKAGLDKERFAPQMEAARWPDLKAELAQVFKTRTRDEWRQIMEGTDVCFAPVLSIFEAPDHPHNKARQTFVEIDGVVQPAPAPRFSRTQPEISRSQPAPGVDTVGVLEEAGFTAAEIAGLQEKRIIPAA